MNEDYTNIDKTANVLEYVHLFTRNIRTIFFIVFVFLLIGWTTVFIKPRKYVSTSKTIHRYSGAQTNFNPSSVRMNNDLEITTSDNISIQGSENYSIGGLPQHIITEITNSNTFLISVANDKCIPAENNRLISYIEYRANLKPKINISLIVKKYTIGLPKLILSKLKRNTVSQVVADIGQTKFFTASELSAMSSLAGMITVDVTRPKNESYLIINFSTRANDPKLSYYMNKAFINNMKIKLQEITTCNVRNSLDYINIRFDEVRVQLTQAESELAKFMDRNLDPQDARLKVEVERLKRKVSFISILYQDLQSKKTQIELNLQKTEPVYTTIMEPLPGKKENRGLKKATIKYFIFGFGIAVIFIFFKINMEILQNNSETSEKLSVIMDDLKNNYIYVSVESIYKLKYKFWKNTNIEE